MAGSFWVCVGGCVARPRFAGAAALLIVLIALPTPGLAQPRLRLTWGLEFSESYDDNLFGSPTSYVRQGDIIYRAGPRFGLSYTSKTLKAHMRYARDGELFGWRSELNSKRARQEEALALEWSPVRALSLDAGALFEDTTAARDLNRVTGLESPRLPAEHLSTTLAASLRLGDVTRLRAEHAFDRERTKGFPSVDARIASVVLERRFGPLDQASMSFSRRDIGAAASVTTSHVLAFGWIRQVTPRAIFDVKAGPRLSSDGSVGPELSLTLRGNLRRGDVTLSYTQTEATAVGHRGRIAVQGVSVRVHHRLSRHLAITGGPGVIESREGDSEALVYQGMAALEAQLPRRLGLIASWTWSRQEGTLGGSPLVETPHHTFSLRLAAGSTSSRESR